VEEQGQPRQLDVHGFGAHVERCDGRLNVPCTAKVSTQSGVMANRQHVGGWLGSRDWAAGAGSRCWAGVLSWRSARW
jgi:hypothetical protein